jgi:tRNA dimethylallyltransferase
VKNRIIAIIGPTSSGKSDLAIKLAKKFNGEIISADSRQVYRGLDITTGKVKKKEQRMAKHHCLDIVDPPKRWKGGVQPFTLQQYRQCADAAIQDIWKRGKLPILVGGTQLYVRAVLYEYDLPPVPPDSDYRKKLENKPLKALQQQLYRIDSKMREWKDRENKRRVIRALEIYHTTKKKPSQWYLSRHSEASAEVSREASMQRDPAPAPQVGADGGSFGMTLRYNALQLCIDVPREKLYRRIDERVDARIKRGMIREVVWLREQGISKKWLKSLGLECRLISEYLEKVEKKRGPHMVPTGQYIDEMIQRLKYAIHQYSRRQLTWYRKGNDITYVTSYSHAARIISLFLSSVIKSRMDFSSLRGSLKSSVRLSDRELRTARASFEKQWARKF